MFEAILLKCIQSLRGERSISGIFHLIQGKRSSQTLQDAKIYNIDLFFATAPSIKKEQVEEAVVRMAAKGWVYINEEKIPVIREEGHQVLNNSTIETRHYLNGMTLHKHVNVFEKRLRLLIQTITRTNLKDFSFIPIEDDIETQRWVKYIYRNCSAEEMITNLHNELYTLLLAIDKLEAELFTARITGGRVTGRTKAQLASRYDLSKEDVDLYVRHTFYYLLQSTLNAPQSYKALFMCAEGLEGSNLITASAKQTHHLLTGGYTLEQICNRRRLKISTIQDHIVEAALVVPDFDISTFVSADHQAEIAQALNLVNSNKLRELYEAMEKRFDYFQLRLVKARLNYGDKEVGSYVSRTTS
ncbi:helix-turn-helix domain-containing protein [Halobacillus sp. A5]|uniref:helix-turn-helix domain-containing protein n=1 Tax=Halobacillus sp. A5 TaxID=2880263 RepID=UPI0020A68D79|nr:helix-turn-helix domain-containing protein [Halobacillus sp. A5]MCP3025823.1 helix-turn-helix domain-containing protein [Halobacillus sp. A5]